MCDTCVTRIGNPTDPCYTSPFPAADDARYSGSFTHEGVDYAKSVFYGDGCCAPICGPNP